MNYMVPDIFRVDRIIKETKDVFTIGLSFAQKNGRFKFLPGQFNMLYCFGVGEIPISISSSHEAQEGFSHTIRKVGAVTKALACLEKKSLLGIRGPFGSSWPIDDALGKDVVIIAGGIGIAPLRPLVYYILSHRENFGKIFLVYGVKAPGEILYRDELEAWRARFDIEVNVTCDIASGAWKGNVGVVTNLISRVDLSSKNVKVFICGPEIMMQFAIRALIAREINTSDIVVSMERNMKCGVGLCGHCQCGPYFICKDGPVFGFDRVAHIFDKREI